MRAAAIISGGKYEFAVHDEEEIQTQFVVLDRFVGVVNAK